MYKTSDLGMAAALQEIGHQLIELDKTNPRRVVFIFNDSEELKQAISDWNSDKLQVNPRRYMDTLKHLKTRVYGG